MPEKILVVEDEPEMLKVLSRFLARKNYQVYEASNGEDAWRLIGETLFDLVISDMALDGLDGIELLRRVRSTDGILPFIMITGVGTIESAVEAIKLGAFHYITKPFKLRDIEILTQRALEFGSLHRKLDTIRSQEENGSLSEMMIGNSKSMQELLRKVEKISDSLASVLVQGETGTGKSLLARKIHESSSRREKPFLTIDCGALTDTLLESELFGHVKGAFTGAIRAKRGLLEEAQGGTIFLDEIAEISLPTQVKLLRAIQEKEIKPVGGNNIVSIDVRFVSASSRDFRVALARGEFREELYYRLAVIPLFLPPLRDRPDDILPLVDHFVKRFCKLYRKKSIQVDPQVLQMLFNSSWRGNIRELANILERGVLMSENSVITIDCVCSDPCASGASETETQPENLRLRRVVEAAEKEAIVHALRAAKDNRTLAAQMLGISRRALYDKIGAYGIRNEPARLNA